MSEEHEQIHLLNVREKLIYGHPYTATAVSCTETAVDKVSIFKASKFRCGESATDIRARNPRPVPVDIAAVISEVTGKDEVAIGGARFSP